MGKLILKNKALLLVENDKMESKAGYRESSPDGACVIRRAVGTDIDELMSISRKSFSDRPVWNTSRIRARKMWEAILSWDCTETWVCISDNNLAGFITIVSDYSMFQEAWQNQIEKYRNSKLSTCIFHPMLMMNMLWGKFLIYIQKSKSNKKRINVSELCDEAFLWIANVAVDSRMRRKGIGKKLIAHTKNRASELGKKVAILKVLARNIPARKLYEDTGFDFISSDYEYAYYKISINIEK